MQLKWLRVLLPKIEDHPGKKSFAYSASEVSMKCTGRKQTARKTIAIKSHLSAKKQQPMQKLRISKERIENCDHVEGCGKEINEMLMFCVKCKDIQQFGFAELQEHCQQEHPEEKPVFVCSRCGFTVDEVEQMNVHAIAHTTDRTLNTQLGHSKEDLSWSREGKLHKTRQLKPDTLYCNKCRFSTKDPLLFQKHILRHEEIQYKCGRCDRVCYTRGEFQRHSVQHTGTFPFKCRYCDYGAVRKDYVVKHTKGVHRDIIKNGGSVLVLPMRKGQKKKAFSKPKNIFKVRRTATTENENSANMSLHDRMVNSSALAPNPNRNSCDVQELDIAVLPKAALNSASENKSVDTSTVEYVKHLNCSPTDARKIQLQVLASSKHTVQPGTPLTLVVPAQVVIPSNCLAQLIEIKTVNGNQQLVFKLIPQVSAAGASALTTFPAQEMQHVVDTEIAQPQKHSMSNHSTLLTQIVDHNELPSVDYLNEDTDADQKNMEINTKVLFSNPPSSVDIEPMASNTSMLESRNEGSPKQTLSADVEQPKVSEPTENDLTLDSQQDPLVSPDVLGEVVHCLQRGALGSKTTGKDLNVDTQEILNQSGKENLTFSESKETQRIANSYLANKVAAHKGKELVSKGDQFCVSGVNNKSTDYIDTSVDATFEKTFVQLPKAVPVLPNKSMYLCDSAALVESSCKTAIKSVKSLPTDRAKANTQLCIALSCKALDVCKTSPLQIFPTSSSNETAVAFQTSAHQITPNCSSVKQTRIVPKSMFGGEYLKCQHAGIVGKEPANPEACKSPFESHSMCSATVQYHSSASVSAEDYDEVHCVSNSYTLGKCENSKKKPDLPHQQSIALKHRKINANDNEIESEYCNQVLVIKTHNQNLQKKATGSSAISLTTVSANGEILSPLHKSELTKEEFSFFAPDIQYAQNTSQDIAINTDFRKQCDLDNSKSIDDTSVDTQWPVISSVFSLSYGTDDVPDSIRWDNNHDNCSSFTSAQETLKTNLCSPIQANSKSLLNHLGEKEHLSESLSQKNPVCVPKSGSRNLSITSSQSVMVNGSPFQLSNGDNLAECLSLLPPLTPLMPPMSPVEFHDSSSADQLQQCVDNIHVSQDGQNLYSGELSLNQSNCTLSLGLSSIRNNNTAVECCTQIDSFVQRNSSNMPSTTGNPLTGTTQNCKTKFSSFPKIDFPNLSPEGVSFQDESLENALSSGIDGVEEPSVSHNIKDTFLVTSAPSGVTSDAFKLQVSTSVNSQIAVQHLNQSSVALAKISEPNTSNSVGYSFYQNVCHSSEKPQEDTTTASVASSLKVCHQLTLQHKVSLFPSSCNSSADPKNVSSTDAVEKLEPIPCSLGKIMQFTEKVTIPSTAKLQSISLSTSSVADNQSNHTKVQLKPPSKISKTHSVLPSSIHLSRHFHKAVGDASCQTEHAVDLVNSQNAAEIKNIVPNSLCENGAGNDNVGQDVQNLFSQLQSKSEISSLHLPAFPLHSTKSQVNLESTPLPHNLVKDTDCTKHETTYKVVSSGIVLRVLNAADDCKLKASTVSYQSVNQSQNLRALCSTPVPRSTAGKSHASSKTKKHKVCAKLCSTNGCSSKAKSQEKSNDNQSSVLVDRPNKCNTISVRTAARQKSRPLKSIAGEQLPLKRRNTRKLESDHIQDEIFLKQIKKQERLIPVITNDHEILKTARKLRLKPFSESQLVKCPRRNQPVVVLNHPDVDVQEVANVMKTIGKYRGHVLKVVLSERTVISLNLKEKHQRHEFENQGILLDKWHNCKVVSPVKEKHMLKMRLKKIHKNNYQIVKNIQSEHLQFKFHCWFCGRMFCDQEEWIAHGQRHLMEATRDWNDVATVQDITENESEVLNVERKSDVE
ncbi:uncharacterized protein [Heterodontus francisci]|uniref:uncharacterized protein n=1 Tax=Heterodontus francisci TaxID=7792 RepID=UPI00355B7106